MTHRKTIQDLTRALKEVNDEAYVCLRETELVKSEDTQAAVAKFYTETFLFYSDAIRWFQSSSTKKIWHSLDEKFSERFKGPLANIQRLSRLVQRATSLGSGAEIRVTRLIAETTKEDLRAGLEGAAREQAESRERAARMENEHEKQMSLLQQLADKDVVDELLQEIWRRAGISGTQLLVGQRRNDQDDRGLKDTQSYYPHLVTAATPDGQEEARGYEDEGRQFTIVDASRLVERLLGSICRGVRVVDVGCPPSLALDQRIAIALERWTLQKDASTLLYLEAAAYSAEARSPQVTVAAARIVEAADKIGLPTLSFFCDDSLSERDPNHLALDDEEASVSPPLLGLVYSLIFQLIQLLPPLTNIGSLITASQIAELNASITSWPLALEILSKLLTVAPSFLLCVVDGFHAFESSGTDLTPTRELLGVLQNAMEVEHKVLKVLFTDSRRAFSLVHTLPMERREIIEGKRRAGNGRASVPAGRTFVDFKTDMMRNV